MTLRESAVRFEGVVPHLRVEDVVRTAEYYRDVLGFEITGYWDGEEVHHDPLRPVLFGIVSRQDVHLHINRVASSDLLPISGDGVYDVYFDIVGVGALAEELRLRNADIVEGPAESVYGRRELVVRDCDGRLLAFGER